MSKLVHYLLVFDHKANELVDQTMYKSAQRAVAAYAEAEKAYDEQPHIEIVLIGSDSLETIRQTHANYFEGVPTSRYFEGIAV